VALKAKPVLERSPLGITVDGVNLADGVRLGQPARYKTDETYPWYGVHATAVDRSNGVRIPINHAKSQTGGAGARVPDEATGFQVPAGSTVWYHDFEGHYEGNHVKREIREVRPGDWAAPPLTLGLPDGAGYASITEGGLRHYAGMGLQADGKGAFLARPAAVTRAITTPWRGVLAGHADYTPTHFGDRRNDTTWAHQIAGAAIFTSPLLTYAAHPKSILENPAADLIKSIPAVWDETLALPVSEIGEVAALARRRGNTWFLAVMNGPATRTIRIPLSFLAAGGYRAMLVRDNPDDAAAVKIENISASRGDSISAELRPGGGFIARFSR
jgi:hypothetical protein